MHMIKQDKIVGLKGRTEVKNEEHDYSSSPLICPPVLL